MATKQDYALHRGFDGCNATSVIKANQASRTVARRENLDLSGGQLQPDNPFSEGPGIIRPYPHPRKWPSSIPVPDFPWVAIEITDVEPLRDLDQVKDMKAVLLQMQFRACANRQSQTLEQIHTATKLTVTCPNVGDGNQPRILASAMLALGFGQINNGPAALSGRIITNGHPEELWAEFKTVVYPVPAAPTPGWGKNTWQVTKATLRGHPPIQVRFQMRGPVVDKWYSYFTRTFLYQLGRGLSRRPDQDMTAPRIDIIAAPQNIRFRLRPFHPGSLEFTVFDEIAVLDLFLRLLLENEARDMTISIMVNMVNVAVGYLDLEQPPMATNEGNSSEIGKSIPAPTMNGTSLSLPILPQSDPALARNLFEVAASINITAVEKGQF
ncbi:MAG: hypothetical protein Q9199_002621 [Rusavskia elegans]